VRSLACFFLALARFNRFFSFVTVSGDTARTILTALLNRSASVSPGTFGAGSGFMWGIVALVDDVFAKGSFPEFL
jgi:hypothetical protein